FYYNIFATDCNLHSFPTRRSSDLCLAVNLADAFISCWDEKYRSVVIRPETYINIYIDPNWLPVLQTPPFPEYTSGHSVVSSSARSEEHTSELQSREHIVCRLLLET